MAHIIKVDGEVIPFERQTRIPAINTDIEMMLNAVVDRVFLLDDRAIFIPHGVPEIEGNLNKLAMLIVPDLGNIYGDVIILEKLELTGE